MARTLTERDCFPLKSARYGVAISWDPGNSPVDVDLQAVVIDNRGAIIDAVYYNNLKALRCITHSGDEQGGEKEGFDEMVWVGIPKLPESVKMILFVVATHTGHLRDVRNGMIHILEEQQQNEVARFAMEDSVEEVDLIASFVNNGRGQWELQVLDEPAQDGRHFIDIVEPTIGNYVRKIIPTAPRRQKVAFAMEKGAVFDLPQSNRMSGISACLGWDVLGDGVDLDVSAVLMDESGRVKDACFFGNLQTSGFQHSGDNLTGAGDGDDEVIQCSLNEIPKSVQQVFFVVNIYTRGVSFDRVTNAYCRIVDSSQTELARYTLSEGKSQQALVIARLVKEVDGRWGFQALGHFTGGQTYKDSVGDLQAICGMAPRELQLRAQSTIAFSGAGTGPSTGRRGVQAAPPPGGNKDCCALQ